MNMYPSTAFRALALMMAGILTGSSEVGRPDLNQNKRVARRYLQAILVPGFDGWDRYFPDTVRFNGHPMPQAALRSILADFTEGFPDLRFTVLGQLADGDRVATWGYFDGTHSGQFASVPPTKRQVKWFGVAIDRIHEGRVVEMWHEMDYWGIVQQINGE